MSPEGLRESDARLRVVLLHRQLAFASGVTRSFLNFAAHHDRDRLRLDVAVHRPPHEGPKHALERAGVLVTELSDNPIRAVRLLHRLLRRNRIDVAVCRSFRVYVVAKIAAIGLGVTVSFWHAGVHLVIDGSVRRLLYRWLSRRDPAIYISKAVRRAQHYDLHRGPEFLVYHGADRSPSLLSAEASRRQLSLPFDRPVIGYVAEFVQWKNHETLLRAFAEVQTEPAAQLAFFGDGPTRSSLMDLAQELDVAERVTFLGAVPGAGDLLAGVDVYAHSADGEGFGWAVLEAMLAERPIAVSDSGSLPELIEADVSGLVVPARDVHEWTLALTRLLEDHELARRLGVAAHYRAKGQFSRDRHIEALTCALEAMLPRTCRARTDA